MTEADFRAFYAETAPALWRYVAKATGDQSLADDIVQESYFRFLRAAPERLGPEERRRYLFRVATNRVRDHFRSRFHRTEAMPPDLAGEDGAAVVDASVLRDDVAGALDALAPRARELLWLAYVEGYSHRDVAAITGLREHSIRPLLYRARQAMAGLLARRGYGTQPTSIDP